MKRISSIVRGILVVAVGSSSAVACLSASDPESPPPSEKAGKSARALGACGDIDYLGECAGETLRWCEGGVLEEVACEADGRTCGWQDDTIGYNCLASSGSSDCGGVTYEGYCDGDTLVWCEGGLRKRDCAADSRTCGYQDATVGYNCLGGGGSPGGGGVALDFGYPVGDKSTYPAGGWYVSQVLGHYYDVYGGVHLAEDIANGEEATANAPVYSVANGVVRYAGPNSSTYVNVVLIEHDLGNGEKVCSFYGHLGWVEVATGQEVSRGQNIAGVLDWVAYQGYANSHLHYVLLSKAMCDASAAAYGALVCGYDKGTGYTGIETLEDEPATWTSGWDECGTQNYPNAFIAPSQFIAAHHF